MKRIIEIYAFEENVNRKRNFTRENSLPSLIKLYYQHLLDFSSRKTHLRLVKNQSGNHHLGAIRFTSIWLLYGCSQCGDTEIIVRKILEGLRCNACGFESPLGAHVAQNLIKPYERGELAENVQAWFDEVG